MYSTCRKLAVVLALSCPFSLAAEAITENFIHVDGKKVHCACQGNGTHTLLIEPGLGVAVAHPDETSWDGFINAAREIFRVCYYDRSGLHQGDKLGPHNSKDVAKRTFEVAKAIENGTPVIMVAHSFGGIHAKVIHHHYPDVIDGLVLVDTTPYGSDAWAKKEFSQSNENESPEFTQFKNQFLGYRDNPALNAEKLRIMDASLEADGARDFGHKPVATVQRTMQYKDEVTPPAFLPDDLTDRWDQLYRDSEQVYKGLSSNTRFIRSSSTSHFLHQASEDLSSVMAAVDWVVAQLNE